MAATNTPSLPLPTGAHSIECCDESLWLLPERAIYWPARHTLLVADVHFGKAAHFRALGQPVPSGTTQQNIERLDALIEHNGACSLIVLGDFLHDAISCEDTTFLALTNWLDRRASLDVTVIIGNHDRRAPLDTLPLRIRWVNEPYRLGPFNLCHHPQQSSAEGFTLSGHLHPAYILRSGRHDRLRLPCFVWDTDAALLPAFGEFTGHLTIHSQPNRAIYVIGGGRVWPTSTPTR